MQDLVDFIKQFPSAHYNKDQTILSADEQTNMLYIIASGFVKVSSIDSNGSEQVLWIAGRSDIVPSELLFYKTSRLGFFYTALSLTTVYMVDKTVFLEFAEANMAVMKEVARAMSNHYDDLLYRLSSIVQASARDKLLSTLNNLAERFSASESVDLYELGLHLTHQDIANLVGITRETTSIELKKFKNEGLLDYDRHHFIIHVDALQKELG